MIAEYSLITDSLFSVRRQNKAIHTDTKTVLFCCSGYRIEPFAVVVVVVVDSDQNIGIRYEKWE